MAQVVELERRRNFSGTVGLSGCKWSCDTGYQDLFLFLGVSQRIDIRVRFNAGGDDDIRLLGFASGLLAGNRGPGSDFIKKVGVYPHCSTPRDGCANKSLLLLVMGV